MAPPSPSPGDMIEPFEARRLLLERARPLEPEETSPEDALHRWLAGPVHAPAARPEHDNSAMDGFAVRTADAASATPEAPVWLRVVGEARVAEAHERPLAAGEAVRISTGGPVPPGADAIVPVERTAQGGDAGEVAVLAAPSPGAHIRPRGEEVMPGDDMLPAGLRVNPAAVGLLSSMGIEPVPVHRRPRVAAVVTGDEFARGARDANGPLLRALCHGPELELVEVEYAGDRAEELADTLHRLSRRADVVVTTGGASVGPHDVVEEAWEELGARTLFRKVAVKPGKPVGAGVLGPTLLLALPGNPQSVLAGFEFFAEPLLRRLAGGEGDGGVHVRVPAAREIPGNRRTQLLRGRLSGRGEETVFEAPAVQGSGMLLQAARYPLVARVEPSPDALPAGSRVRVRGGTEGLAGWGWVPDPEDAAQEEP